MKIYRITTDLDGKELDAVILDTQTAWLEDPGLGKTLQILFEDGVESVLVKKTGGEVDTYSLKNPFK